MGMIRTLGSVTVAVGTPTPIYTGTVIAAVSFSITNNIASIVLGAANLPKNGYNGPNGYPTTNATTGAKFDIYGGIAGSNSGGSANGQQVTLWGFTTATYFNGKTITVLDNDPSTGTFRFYFTHANVGSTADTGNTAAIPVDRVRKVRIEISAAGTAATDKVYVGDGNVSALRYYAALMLASTTTWPVAIEIDSFNIPADRIFIDGTAVTDKVQVSLIY